MGLYKGTVVNGEVVIDGGPLPEGALVKVFVPEDGESFDFTPEQRDELDASIAALDPGRADFDSLVLEKLRSVMRGTQ